jgi:hypothetical protein
MMRCEMLRNDDIEKPIKKVSVGQHQIEVIRINWAAFRPYDLEIREFWRILPGVKVVKTLDFLRAQDDTDIFVIDDKTFTFDIRSRDSGERKVVTYKFGGNQRK